MVLFVMTVDEVLYIIHYVKQYFKAHGLWTQPPHITICQMPVGSWFMLKNESSCQTKILNDMLTC